MVPHLSIRPRAARKGTTLLELLFAVAGLSLVLGSALAVYMVGLDTYRRESGGNQSCGAAHHALEFIKRDIRNASRVVADGGGHTSDADTLALLLPSYDSSGTIDGKFDCVVYDVGEDSVLRRTVIASSGSDRASEAARALVRGVASVQFTYTVHDFSQSDGSATSFPLSAVWVSAPSCRVDGVPIASGVSYNFDTLTAFLSSPAPSGSVVEFVYQTSSDYANSITTASEIGITVTGEPGSSFEGSQQLRSSARLRNRS